MVLSFLLRSFSAVSLASRAGALTSLYVVLMHMLYGEADISNVLQIDLVLDFLPEIIIGYQLVRFISQSEM